MVYRSPAGHCNATSPVAVGCVEQSGHQVGVRVEPVEPVGFAARLPLRVSFIGLYGIAYLLNFPQRSPVVAATRSTCSACVLKSLRHGFRSLRRVGVAGPVHAHGN